LKPCEDERGETGARCGTIAVWENRDTRSGRRLALKVVVLPALEEPPEPDAVVFLAGGPGQAATDFAPFLADSPLRRRRPIVLLDQRGTGQSHALECGLDESDLQGVLAGIFSDLRAIADCRKRLERQADLAWYTTPVAMDDLAEVLTALGYSRVNLIGGSYGSRAALEFLRRYPERVRAAVLDAPAPTAFKNPLFHARSAQEALDLVLEHCAEEAACHRAYPQVRAELNDVLRRLEDARATVTVEQPDGSGNSQILLDRDAFAEALRVFLYDAETGRRVPQLIQAAFDGELERFAQAALQANLGLRRGLPLGMLLSATCTEDVARISEAEIRRETAGTFLGDTRVRQQKAACDLWPRGIVPDDYGEPVTGSAPTLVISGMLDPVTPPRWGDETVRHLAQALHVVVPAAHGAAFHPCLQGAIEQFIAAGTVEGLDLTCVDSIHLPPFDVPELARLREVLEAERQAHLRTDADALAAHLAATVLSVDAGTIREVPRGEMRDSFARYFSGARYERWEDLEPPRIELSDDGSMATVARRVSVARTTNGRVRPGDTFVSSYLASYRVTDGQWLLTSVASSFEAPGRVEEIRSRAVAAMGGPDEVARVEAVRAHALAEGPGGSFEVEVLSHRNGGVRAAWSGGPTLGVGPGPGEGWMAGPDGVAPLEPSMVGFVRGHELHMLAIAPETRLDGLAFTGRVSFEGEPALRLTGVDARDRPVELYYGVESGLPLGLRLIDDVRPERGAVTTTFLDWGDVDGVRLFRGARFEQGDEVFRYRYDLLEILDDVDESELAPPGS
jgi:pimeloyl-ACP methyl ester carboxylesterase